MKISDKIIITIIIIFLLCFLSLKRFSNKNENILLSYASLKSTNLVNTIINKSIREIIFDNKNNDLIIDYKNVDGQIVNIDFNTEKINKITYLVSEELLKNINSFEEDIKKEYKIDNKLFYVPYGVIYDLPILANIGPKIPFKMDFLGSVNPETTIDIKEYGINSSLVEVNLNIDLVIEVILPFKSKKEKISKKIILDSKIVQGKIPNYYGGIISSSLK